MTTKLTRSQSLELLKEYNKEPFHILHGLTVESVVKWFANDLGYSEEADFWGLAGLLHDLDYEMYPVEHCIKCIEILEKVDAEPELIRAICSHGYDQIDVFVEPVHQMEKVLFACDELTGLIGASVRMRPSQSIEGMELSSLKKKFKNKKFAAGCSRDVIQQGADYLGWTLDELFQKTIDAMTASEKDINEQMEKYEKGEL